MSNDPKLHELTSEKSFRAKVSNLIDALAGRGYDPKIFETKRTMAQQIEKVRKGYSKTLNSYHLKRGVDGGGKAADIASKRHGWSPSRRFWFLMGGACQSFKLGWGGLFGLTRAQKATLANALDELRALGWPEEHPLYYSVKIGWDPAHVQLDGGISWP